MEASSSSATGMKVVSKLVRKLKTVLRKESTSHEAGQPSHITAVGQSVTPVTEQSPSTTAHLAKEGPVVTIPEPHMMQTPAGTDLVIEADTFDEEDRRQAILVKYNLDLEQTRWPSHPFIPAERVSKPIRMRVRYTCHRCKTSFGHDKECHSCRHRRCARCDRYPPRKARPAAESNTAVPAPEVTAGELIPDKLEPATTGHICTCHECQTVVEIEVEQCPNCRHTICERCYKEARVQPSDPHEADNSSKGPPEEQKLPPDSGVTEDQPPPESR